MGFQTSTSISNPAEILGALATFAAANGWTVVRNTLNGGVRELSLRKTGVSDYVHFISTTGAILMNASVGYDAGASFGSQPDRTPNNAQSNALVGPYPKVWFFADGNEINVVVRRSDTTGAYSHLSFGVMSKYGTFAGGTYVDGSYFSQTGSNSGAWDSQDHAMLGYGIVTNQGGYVRADSDGLTNSWKTIYSYNSSGGPAQMVYTNVGPLGSAGMYNDGTANTTAATFDIGRLINAADDNVFSGRSFLQVIEFFVRRAGSPIYFSPLGYVANTRYVSLAKLVPEQEISIADEDWVVFPVVRKAAQSSVAGAPNASENNGFAIRKVA